MRAEKVLRVILAALVVLAAAVALLLTQPIWIRHDPPPAAADPVRLERHVKEIAGLVPRNLTDPPNLEAAAVYIQGVFAREGLPVLTQAYDVAGTTVRNIIVRFGEEGGARVVVGAHYDAFGRTAGADDNASGVAGLLELGRLLKLHPPPGTVELVAYPLEEPPFFGGPQMGSEVHAQALRTDVAKVRAMIALEMIGYFSDAKGSQHYPSPALGLLYPSRGNFVAVAGRVTEFDLVRLVKRAMANATDLPVRSINAPPSLGQHDLSDNRSYWNARYRALMVTDTAFFRNTAYHTAGDTPDRLDYGRMAKVVTGVFAAVRALSAP